MPGSLQTNYLSLSQMFPEQSLGSFAHLVVGPLRLDSREVEAGDTFIAIAGIYLDGRDYIGAAIESGAALVWVEGDAFAIRHDGPVPIVTIPQLRQQLSQLASHWFDQPSKKMAMVGVTGTNGKTTCCQWLAQLLNGMPAISGSKIKASSRLGSVTTKAATVGTLGYGLVDQRLAQTGLTTPDAIAFQSVLAQLYCDGANAVVAEVSSHSLEQGRVAAVDFDVAVFTNIGRDHLDYHGSMASYIAAKTSLMSFPSLAAVVINLDDPCAQQFISAAGKGVKVLGYGLTADAADFSVDNVSYKPSGTTASHSSPEGEYTLDLPIWGEFNLCNLLGVVATAHALGYPLAEIVERLSLIRPVPGRLEPVLVDSDITVLIDFAHTPDALESVLRAIRNHIKGNVWCVFGCGGDRDTGKRPLMAAVVQELADYVVVTSDNPRSENPAAIIDDIMAGFQHPGAVHRIEDRETAIRFAIEQAEPGDCVLLAGKGHEDYQLVGTQRLPFSDLSVARLALQIRPATVMESGVKYD